MKNPWLWMLLLVLTESALAAKKPSKTVESPLDRYIREAGGTISSHPVASPGSLYHPGALLPDMVRDLRAAQVDDMVTIMVSDKASAVSKGTTVTSRKSSTSNSITSLFGPKHSTGPLANLAETSGQTKLDGEGQTSRESTLTTTLSARVTHVLANGYLVVEATKDISVNSERQVVTVRGVVRPTDLGSTNTVLSDRVGQLEVRVNGKGVVGDAVRRPFILYRILLGLLPF
jgi:flagellar L-ring protein FlgH